MSLIARFESVLFHVKYKDWKWHVGCDGERLVLQIVTPEWTSRKWFLSPHMTNSEIVQTAFKAVQTAEEHETRKLFKYRSKPIFGPHFNVEKLVDLCEDPEGREFRLQKSEAT